MPLWLLKAVALFLVTALCEIAGCFAFYAWARSGRSVSWLVPGIGALAVFAWLLTRHPDVGAGRTYAAYGGVYIVTSILWLWAVEGIHPDHWDWVGAGLCVLGSLIIIAGHWN